MENVNVKKTVKVHNVESNVLKDLRRHKVTRSSLKPYEHRCVYVKPRREKTFKIILLS